MVVREILFRYGIPGVLHASRVDTDGLAERVHCWFRVPNEIDSFHYCWGISLGFEVVEEHTAVAQRAKCFEIFIGWQLTHDRKLAAVERINHEYRVANDEDRRERFQNLVWNARRIRLRRSGHIEWITS